MAPSFTGAVRDSLSNLAASLGVGRAKAVHDRFVSFDLDRSQLDAMYRGDWLARKVVDIVPYDTVREWRAWSGHRADVARVEAAERRLGLRKAVQRALVLGRLYGGGAVVIGTHETDPAALALPLDPDDMPKGGLAFLHVVSRWQLGTTALERDPMSPWYGEPTSYEVFSADHGSLPLHPSRVVRFLGAAFPDPALAPTPWSDSVLQALYDAVHAVALTTAGATTLMHEAKVDVVTVPNLSEHLTSAEMTAQLSARFAYASAMKSINNLLLLGDGETWARQKVDFAGLPEMVRTFLQVAAGAADIPVTRLLGQSPAGLSATGDSDTRNYYDMIAARQELDLRPQLERLDRLILRSEGLDPDALGFAFRPLWQLDAPAAAALALTKAQTTQVYAGLGLWPAAVTARLVAAQLVADGIYPNAAAVFAEGGAEPGDATPTRDFDPDQPRDPQGRWTRQGRPSAQLPIVPVQHLEDDPDPTPEEEQREIEEQERNREDPLKYLRYGNKPTDFVRIPVLPVGSGKAPILATPSAITPAAPAIKPVAAPPGRTELPSAGPSAASQAEGPILPSAGAASGPPRPSPAEAAEPVSRDPLAKLSGLWKPPTLKSREEIEAHPLMRAMRAISDGDVETFEACKRELPPEVARRLIPGVIGPGPYATQPIPLRHGQAVTDEMRDREPDDGSPNRCHVCNALTLNAGGGRLSLDHQPPSSLNVLDWDQKLYRHCQLHYRIQGGYVLWLHNYMKAEGLKP